MPKEKLQAITDFCDVVALYQETRYSSGDLAARDYTQHGQAAGKATHTGSSQTVCPSSSDFVCDVEIAATRCLTYWELDYFKTYYKSGAVLAIPYDEEGSNFEEFVESRPERFRATVRTVDHRVRLKLGLHFQKVSIVPLSTYKKAVDLRIKPRRPKGRWSHLYGN